MSEDNRRLSAIMFTDMVGFSVLADKDERLADDLLADHNSVLRRNFEHHKGREIKFTGDGFLVEFSTALAAVRCAIEIQSSLQSRNLGVSEERQIDCRIGIHLGEVEEKEGDLFGDGVNIASRVEGLCDPGGIAVSEAVFLQVEKRFDTPLVSLGPQKLKNIEKPLEVYRVSLPWQKSEGRSLTQKSERLDTRFKFAGIVAIAALVLVSSWFISQSLVAPPMTSIAVLPFADFSTQGEGELWRLGIPEQLIHSLSQIDDLKVIARTSSFSTSLEGLTAKEIAQRLGVGAVLEGSIVQTEDNLRVTAQLIRGSDESHLWSEQFDQTEGEVNQIMESIASDVLIKMGYAIDRNDQIVKIGTNCIQCYKAYLDGLIEFSSRGYESAERNFKHAIALDGDYAEAYAGLAKTYALMANYGFLTRDDGFPKAREQALIALDKDPKLGEAYATLGFAEWIHEDDRERAEEYFKQSIELNPNYEPAYRWYGLMVGTLDRPHDSIELLERAVELDPETIFFRGALAVPYAQIGEYNKAIEILQAVSEMDPESGQGLAATAYELLGDWSKAEELLKHGISLDNQDDLIYGRYALHLIRRGRVEDAKTQIEKAMELRPLHDGHSTNYGRILRLNEEYSSAISEFQKRIEDNGEQKTIYLAASYIGLLDFEAALEELDKLPEYNSFQDRYVWKNALRAIIDAGNEHTDEALNVIDALLQQPARRDTYYAVALIYFALEDRDNGFKWLSKAFEERRILDSLTYSTRYPELRDIRVEPLLEGVREDPRFQELLAKMGLAD